MNWDRKPDMTGRKILIAGASSGIGRAVALAAAMRGARCVLSARREDALEETRSQMVDPAAHTIAQLDFSARDEIELALMRLFTAEGPFDGVVYSVGVCPVTPLARQDLASFEETLRVNCGGFLALMKFFSTRGAYRPGAAAVAVSSVSAQSGWAGGSAYCASKGALSALARALDVELAPKKIRVRAIEPSHVRTAMFAAGAGRMGVPVSDARPPETIATEILSILCTSC